MTPSLVQSAATPATIPANAGSAMGVRTNSLALLAGIFPAFAENISDFTAGLAGTGDVAAPAETAANGIGMALLTGSTATLAGKAMPATGSIGTATPQLATATGASVAGKTENTAATPAATPTVPGSRAMNVVLGFTAPTEVPAATTFAEEYTAQVLEAEAGSQATPVPTLPQTIPAEVKIAAQAITAKQDQPAVAVAEPAETETLIAPKASLPADAAPAGSTSALEPLAIQIAASVVDQPATAAPTLSFQPTATETAGTTKTDVRDQSAPRVTKESTTAASEFSWLRFTDWATGDRTPVLPPQTTAPAVTPKTASAPQTVAPPKAAAQAQTTTVITPAMIAEPENVPATVETSTVAVVTSSDQPAAESEPRTQAPTPATRISKGATRIAARSQAPLTPAKAECKAESKTSTPVKTTRVSNRVQSPVTETTTTAASTTDVPVATETVPGALAVTTTSQPVSVSAPQPAVTDTLPQPLPTPAVETTATNEPQTSLTHENIPVPATRTQPSLNTTANTTANATPTFSQLTTETTAQPEAPAAAPTKSTPASDVPRAVATPAPAVPSTETVEAVSAPVTSNDIPAQQPTRTATPATARTATSRSAVRVSTTSRTSTPVSNTPAQAPAAKSPTSDLASTSVQAAEQQSEDVEIPVVQSPERPTVDAPSAEVLTSSTPAVATQPVEPTKTREVVARPEAIVSEASPVSAAPVANSATQATTVAPKVRTSHSQRIQNSNTENNSSDTPAMPRAATESTTPATPTAAPQVATPVASQPLPVVTKSPVEATPVSRPVETVDTTPTATPVEVESDPVQQIVSRALGLDRTSEEAPATPMTRTKVQTATPRRGPSESTEPVRTSSTTVLPASNIEQPVRTSTTSAQTVATATSTTTSFSSAMAADVQVNNNMTDASAAGELSFTARVDANVEQPPVSSSTGNANVTAAQVKAETVVHKIPEPAEPAAQAGPERQAATIHTSSTPAASTPAHVTVAPAHTNAAPAPAATVTSQPLDMTAGLAVEPQAPVVEATSRNFSVKIAGDNQSQATLRISESAGSVKVSVHTPDEGLSRTLQSELGSLSNRMEEAGVRAQVWTPSVTGPSSASGAETRGGNDSGGGRSHDGRPQSQSQSQSQQTGSEADPDRQQRRSRWTEQMERQYAD